MLLGLSSVFSQNKKTFLKNCYFIVISFKTVPPILEKRPNFQNGQKAGKTGQNGQNVVIFSQASDTLNNQVIPSPGNPQMRWTLSGGYLFKCKYQTFHQVSEKTSQ